jgi:hypothetical protein
VAESPFESFGLMQHFVQNVASPDFSYIINGVNMLCPEYLPTIIVNSYKNKILVWIFTFRVEIKIKI